MELNKDKLIIILALITILLALYVTFDSYGRIQQAYELCLNKEVIRFAIQQP